MSCSVRRFLLPATQRYRRHVCNVLGKSSRNPNCNVPNSVASVTNALDSSRTISTTSYLSKKERVNVTFVKHNGEKITATGKEGESFLDVVVNNNLNFEGYGACEGTISCSTCHLIFSPEDYERLEEKETDEERDMLDLAMEMTPTSRLGCQVTLTKDMKGWVVRVPQAVRDVRENIS